MRTSFRLSLPDVLLTNCVRSGEGYETRTLATSIQYEPIGPLKRVGLGNGGTRINHYDTDYRLTDIETDQKLGYHFDYDANDRITHYTNFAKGGWSYDFTYDQIHRLTSATSVGLGNESFTYDSNGNRLTHAHDEGTSAYSISNANNRINGVATGGLTRSFTYASNGNIATSGSTSYTYNALGRLTGVGSGVSYQIGPDGTRFLKNVKGRIVDFIYEDNGRLLSEYSRSSDSWTSYIWFNGEPLGLVRNDTLYYIQTDHLGRPEVITNQSGQRAWRANLRPFDRDVITNTIGGFNLGFPGQYHDDEVGLAYNINRNYVPDLGRYLESDPIGLNGGINTYVYGLNNPISIIDPLGLCGMGWGMSQFNPDASINISGIQTSAAAQQMKSQAEAYARDKTAEASAEFGKCAAKEALTSIAEDYGVDKALNLIEDQLIANSSRLGPILLWGRMAWSYSGAGLALTGAGIVDSAYGCGIQAINSVSSQP